MKNFLLCKIWRTGGLGLTTPAARSIEFSASWSTLGNFPSRVHTPGFGACLDFPAPCQDSGNGNVLKEVHCKVKILSSQFSPRLPGNIWENLPPGT